MENLLDSGWERTGQSQCVGNDHTRVKKGGEDQPRSCGPPPMQLQLGPPCSKLELNHLHLLSICIFHPDCPIVITLTISPPTILHVLKNKMQSSVHVILTTLLPFCEALTGSTVFTKVLEWNTILIKYRCSCKCHWEMQKDYLPKVQDLEQTCMEFWMSRNSWYLLLKKFSLKPSLNFRSHCSIPSNRNIQHNK